MSHQNDHCNMKNKNAGSAASQGASQHNAYRAADKTTTQGQPRQNDKRQGKGRDDRKR